MGGGNGAKAKQARQRNAEKYATKNTPGSQTKSNEKARSIVCKICRNPFLLTARAPELEQHAQNKHSKTMAECFPDVSG